MRKPIFLSIALLLACMTVKAQTIDVGKAEAKPLDHFWSVGTCAGRANEGLRTSWVEQLKVAQENCGFRYLRMHGLFDDDMCVYFEKPDGRAVYSWQYIDEVYDRMLSLGVRPFVELSFFPKGIAADNSKQQMWYGNRVTPDRSRYPKWHNMIAAFCQHLIDRYGIDEVSQWYFEVWNEPNLDFGFFDGTKSDYFELYKTTVKAIKGVSERLRVGGPATSNFIADDRHKGERIDNKKSVFYPQETINKQQWKGVWIEEFLDYCAKESLPCDFIACHAYPTDYALDPVSKKGKDAVRYVHSLRDDLNWLRGVIGKSKYPNAEIHITEWSTSPNSRDVMHDLLPPAAYIVKASLECQHLANSVMYWTFTDIFEEKGGGEEIFHGGFGMINFQGIVKPSFHAYCMLNQLGDKQLYNTDPLVVSRNSKTGKLSAIAYNYPVEYEEKVPSAANRDNFMDASAKSMNLTLKGLKPETSFIVETLDNEHGYSYAEWEKMGRPHSPNHSQTDMLRQSGWNTKKEYVKSDADGVLKFSHELSPWSVVLIVEQ